MSGFTVQVEFDDADFARVCNTLIERGLRVRPLMASIGEALVESTEKRFSTKIAPDGQSWLPLKKRTLARKAGKGSILVLHGYLRDLLRAEPSEEDVVVGSAEEYSALHQFGGTPGMPAGPAAVPARSFLGISTADADTIRQLAIDYLDDALSASP
ncbi:phage virion morphogenesis protein [Ahniella affigens]|uniref:Phage virion morphogenesis protein n=1 Tax=Ahniella affigens TaxID=2021234 RepID=A0A2P1PSW5_9GAMM|nr:phage virion morphogenesis protein [Ahniella affigens]AVP97910.1 phage virion morphogenesis protein [Ahniella affigens]